MSEIYRNFVISSPEHRVRVDAFLDREGVARDYYLIVASTTSTLDYLYNKKGQLTRMERNVVRATFVQLLLRTKSMQDKAMLVIRYSNLFNGQFDLGPLARSLAVRLLDNMSRFGFLAFACLAPKMVSVECYPHVVDVCDELPLDKCLTPLLEKYGYGKFYVDDSVDTKPCFSRL
jgi:hypothetical protein